MEAKVETTVGQLPKSPLRCELMSIAFAKKDFDISPVLEYVVCHQVDYQLVRRFDIIWEDLQASVSVG